MPLLENLTCPWSQGEGHTRRFGLPGREGREDGAATAKWGGSLGQGAEAGALGGVGSRFVVFLWVFRKIIAATVFIGVELKTDGEDKRHKV